MSSDIKIAHNINEATLPLRNWDVQVLIRQLVTATVPAQTPEEALRHVVKQPGVMWVFAETTTPSEQPLPQATNSPLSG